MSVSLGVPFLPFIPIITPTHHFICLAVILMVVSASASTLSTPPSEDAVPMSKSESLAHSPESTGSLFGGYTILAKSMMGSGLLGVAAACSKDGWILGLAISVLIPIVTFVSLHLLALLAVRFEAETRGQSRPITFFKLSDSVLGKSGGWFVEISLILKTFGASIVYLQVAGSMLSTLIAPSVPSIDPSTLCRIIQVAMALTFSPFCYLRKITNTTYINAIGIMCLLFVVVASCVYFDAGSQAATSLYPQSAVSVLSKIPIFVFAYSCHQNVFPCIAEVKNPTTRRLDVVMGLACLTGFLIYTPVMVFPYATFGSGVSDNFLKNLPSDDIITKIAYVCAAVSVCVSFPLQILPLRNAVCGLMALNGGLSGKREKMNRYAVATVAILLSLSIALAVSSLGVVMSITGLVGGNTVCFLMPSLLYVKKFERDHSLWYVAAGLLAGSIALYPLCLVGIFMTL